MEETQFWDGHSYIVRARELTGQLRCLPDAQRPEFQGRMAKERFPVGRPLTLMAHMLTQYRLQKRESQPCFLPRDHIHLHTQHSRRRRRPRAESLALARLLSPKKPTPSGGADTPVSLHSLRHKSHSAWTVVGKKRALHVFLPMRVLPAISGKAWFLRPESLWPDKDELPFS